MGQIDIIIVENPLVKYNSIFQSEWKPQIIMKRKSIWHISIVNFDKKVHTSKGEKLSSQYKGLPE